MIKRWLKLMLIWGLLPVCGCSSVAPWQKGIVGDSTMQFQGEQSGAVYEQHMLNAREASSGGYGGSGGGCGCK